MRVVCEQLHGVRFYIVLFLESTKFTFTLLRLQDLNYPRPLYHIKPKVCRNFRSVLVKRQDGGDTQPASPPPSTRSSRHVRVLVLSAVHATQSRHTALAVEHFHQLITLGRQHEIFLTGVAQFTL